MSKVLLSLALMNSFIAELIDTEITMTDGESSGGETLFQASVAYRPSTCGDGVQDCGREFAPWLHNAGTMVTISAHDIIRMINSSIFGFMVSAHYMTGWPTSQFATKTGAQGLVRRSGETWEALSSIRLASTTSIPPPAAWAWES